MALINHNLSSGDLVLYQGPLSRASVMYQPSVLFQIQYAGIIANNVKIQVAFRINSDFDWVVDPSFELVINPALTSDYIRIYNPGFEEVQFTLKTNGVTVGVLNKAAFKNN